MKRWSDGWKPRSITFQITGIVAISVLLVSAVAFTVTAREPGLAGGIQLCKAGTREEISTDQPLSSLGIVTPQLQWWVLLLLAVALTLSVVPVVFALLCVYVRRRLQGPLAQVAAAARSFGRFPEDAGAAECEGPREVVDVADAFNEMRARTRALLDERTRIFAAISHDLRTPLTRLRLRAERGESPSREGVLRDLAWIGQLLEETLNYLRQQFRAERSVHADLPTLLQTVCTEFADSGYAVEYQGPERLTWTCKPTALRRAIINIVENAVKHASSVAVTLEVRENGVVEIAVSDDGPGIPLTSRDDVFDPFFKIETARPSTASTGFGLGLSIARDMIRSQRGEIDLLERAPHGLIVRIALHKEVMG